VKLSAQQLGDSESAEAAMLLKAIGDFERISDHSVSLLASAEELKQKGTSFSESAKKELDVMIHAVEAILELSINAFIEGDFSIAKKVEPLEQVIDDLKDQLRTRHILRLQQGSCNIETGFVWNDMINSLERTSDHCSNIASGIIDLHNQDRNTHEMLRSARNESSSYKKLYLNYTSEFNLK
jgi:phosphate:Na+ symporter